MFKTGNASRRSREVVARGLAVVVIVLGMAVLAGSSEPQRTFGHGTVDQEFSTGLHASSALSYVDSLAQSFTPTESVVVALDLLLTTDGQTTSGPITVSANVREATFAGQWGAVIGTGVAGVPAGTTATPLSPHVLHVELPTPANVTPGTAYVIQIEPVVELYWAANTSGGYVGGNGYVGTSSYPTIDFGFRTYYEVASPSDTTPPVISYDLDPELPANGWYNTDVTLDWTVSDPESSVVLDGCDDLALEEDRDIAASTCSASSAGGSSGPVSVEFGRDTVAPTVLATVTAGTASNDWYRTDVTVGFSCDDDRAGIEPDACPSEQTLSDEGTVSSTAETVRDRAGNESAPSNIVTVQIDQTKPTISASISSGTMGDGDWYVSDVVVHFTCADADGSGIPEDGCPGDQTLGGDGAAVTSTGATVFDTAGNESDVSNLITVAIDQTDPATEASASPTPNEAGWNSTAVTVTFSATDETSGVAGCDSAVTLSMDGAGQSATGSCSDQAGNSQSASAVSINIDGTAPEVTVAASRPPDSGADTYDHPVTFTATGSDGLSGIAYCDPPETYSGPFSSTVVVEMACADNAGNIGTAAVTFQYVDGTPPSISFVLSPPLPASGWYTTAVTLTWSIVEAESPGTLVVSGCADQSLSVDRPLTTYSCGATSAGGEATVVEVEFGRDATKPTLAAAVTGAAGASGWFTGDVAVTFSCTDDGSGVATDTVLDASVTTEGAGQSVTSGGSCIDRAGNAADPITVGGINVDKTPPTAVLAVLSGTLGSNGWYTSHVVVRASGTDDVSGPVTCTADQTLSENTAARTFTGSCTNAAGLTTDAVELTVKLDRTAPTLAPSLSSATVVHGGSLTVTPNATDATSGVASSSCGSIDTSIVGTHDVTCEATDQAGNHASATIDYQVLSGGGVIVYGFRPPSGGGYGTFSFGGGTFDQLLAAAGCPRSTSVFFFNKRDGGFAAWIPGSEVSAVNAEFLAIFAGTPPLPDGSIFTARCV